MFRNTFFKVDYNLLRKKSPKISQFKFQLNQEPYVLNTKNVQYFTIFHFRKLKISM